MADDVFLILGREFTGKMMANAINYAVGPRPFLVAQFSFTCDRQILRLKKKTKIGLAFMVIPDASIFRFPSLVGD